MRVEKLNVAKTVCNHIIGENHTNKHRMTCGAVIIVVGMVTCKGAALIEGRILESFVEGIGFLIHGIGSLPYVELISKIGKQDEPKSE